ncbi:Uncharacterised protein [Mycobacterium tuberculosis]|uniref:Uncharacterized protein n=1 Tax=Mycobacterium tuberculosis TaxID=1773 RepID=A0A655FZH7_MYCTX|nr:Uncharacterised protein [Mycobacterium tuberculosis]CKT44756.1 Uncharacterised protein [Mycobacterium tuberculosis]CKU81129.1 Uncharacterised protein [Mycobacterium tuberculosis]CKV14440.1 Uncharacterised protein [Mycobacterium tuberculosis]CNW76175.1 Uncharacterised protein [Mycobacterium tuberculosis]
MIASGMTAARNQSVTEANGNEELKPTSSISSVPSTMPATSGSRW